MKVTVESDFGGRKLTLTTGEWAKQASGAVVAQYGETVLFVAAVVGPPRPGIDFFPLQVDYRERMAAAGKFAGGYLKREGRPTTREILTCRLTDRPIRPLFPDGYIDEVQIQANVLVFDGENDPDVLSTAAASAALMLSPAPFQGPVASVRVGRIDGELVLMPTIEQMEKSSLDLIVAGTEDAVTMIEGFGDQIPEAEMADAIMYAFRAIQTLCKLQRELVAKAGIAPKQMPEVPVNPFTSVLHERAYQVLRSGMQSPKKAERQKAANDLKAELLASLFPEGAEVAEGLGTLAQFKQAFYELENKVVRDLILDGIRLDGRKKNELRHISAQVGVLPRVHGSAVFTRGETQSLATVVLGTPRDQQKTDTLWGETSARFMLHYYFPSYSVGEVRPIRGPGRREIGHGCLAERSVERVLPSAEKFPYTIRVISDIMESNGSSSMASVCSATLSLMEAGVPLIQPVAGISIGLVMESKDRYTLLTDIIGDEDHFGDMDFKVAGTPRGVTGIQLDLKNKGITEQIIRETLDQARVARFELLKSMLSVIPRPKRQMSPYAPRLERTSINPEKIGLLIGPGGKTIRSIQEESGVQIDVTDDGTVVISGDNAASVDAAMARIEALTEEIRVGRIYNGTVSSIKEFGAFVEIAPGKDGLCHISELADGFVKSVGDIVRIGDKIEVKVISVDEQNRVKLSRKAALAELSGGANGEPAEVSAD